MSKKQSESKSFEILWNMIGKDVTEAVRTRKVPFIPHREVGRDYTPVTAAKMLVQQEIDSLLWQLQDAVDFDPSRNLMAYVPTNWAKQLFISCELLGLSVDDAASLNVAAYMAAIEWQRSEK